MGSKKKMEYYPSNIIIKNFNTDKAITKYLLGEDSSLTIDQKKFISNAKDSDIFKLLY